MNVTISMVRLKDFFRKNRSIKEVLQVFSSNILTLLVSFASSVIIARELGAEGKGLLSVLLVYPTLIMSISQMGIRQATVYEIGRKKFNYEKIIRNVVSLFLVSSTLGFVLCCVIIFSTNDVFSTAAVILAGLSIPFGLLKAYAGGIFLGKEKIGLSTVVGWLPAVLSLLFVIIFLVVMDLGVIGVLLSTLIAGIPMAVFSIYHVTREASILPSYDKKIQKNLISLGSVYAIAVFVNSLNYRIDIILLERLSTPGVIGQYSVGVNFAELVLQVPTAVGMVIFSKSSNTKNPKLFSDKMMKPLVYSFFLAVVGALFIAMVSPTVIPFIYSEEFSDSVSMLQLLLPGVIVLVIYKIIGFDLAGKGKPWVSIVSTLPGLVVNIVLNLFWIPKYGGNGAAMASSVSYAVMAIIQWVVYKKIVSNL